MTHFALLTGFTACGIRIKSLSTPDNTIDQFFVTCPACISRME